MSPSSHMTHRKFGVIFLSYFALIILIALLRHHAVSDSVWIIFTVCLLLCCVAPKGLAPIQFVWDRVLQILRHVNTRLLLGFLFFGIFTPIALCRKLLKKDALKLQYDASCKTYRIDTTQMQNDLRRPY